MATNNPVFFLPLGALRPELAAFAAAVAAADEPAQVPRRPERAGAERDSVSWAQPAKQRRAPSPIWRQVWGRRRIRGIRRIRWRWQAAARRLIPSYPIRRNLREVLWVRSILFLLEVPLAVGSLHVSSTFVSARFKFTLLLRGAALGCVPCFASARSVSSASKSAMAGMSDAIFGNPSTTSDTAACADV